MTSIDVLHYYLKLTVQNLIMQNLINLVFSLLDQYSETLKAIFFSNMSSLT